MRPGSIIGIGIITYPHVLDDLRESISNGSITTADDIRHSRVCVVAERFLYCKTRNYIRITQRKGGVDRDGRSVRRYSTRYGNIGDGCAPKTHLFPGSGNGWRLVGTPPKLNRRRREFRRQFTSSVQGIWS